MDEKTTDITAPHSQHDIENQHRDAVHPANDRESEELGVNQRPQGTQISRHTAALNLEETTITPPSEAHRNIETQHREKETSTAESDHQYSEKVGGNERPIGTEISKHTAVLNVEEAISTPLESESQHDIENQHRVLEELGVNQRPQGTEIPRHAAALNLEGAITTQRVDPDLPMPLVHDNPSDSEPLDANTPRVEKREASGSSRFLAELSETTRINVKQDEHHQGPQGTEVSRTVDADVPPVHENQPPDEVTNAPDSEAEKRKHGGSSRLFTELSDTVRKALEEAERRDKRTGKGPQWRRGATYTTHHHDAAFRPNDYVGDHEQESVRQPGAYRRRERGFRYLNENEASHDMFSRFLASRMSVTSPARFNGRPGLRTQREGYTRPVGQHGEFFVAHPIIYAKSLMETQDDNGYLYYFSLNEGIIPSGVEIINRQNLIDDFKKKLGNFIRRIAKKPEQMNPQANGLGGCRTSIGTTFNLTFLHFGSTWIGTASGDTDLDFVLACKPSFLTHDDLKTVYEAVKHQFTGFDKSVYHMIKGSYLGKRLDKKTLIKMKDKRACRLTMNLDLGDHSRAQGEWDRMNTSQFSQIREAIREEGLPIKLRKEKYEYNILITSEKVLESSRIDSKIMKDAIENLRLTVTEYFRVLDPAAFISCLVYFFKKHDLHGAAFQRFSTMAITIMGYTFLYELSNGSYPRNLKALQELLHIRKQFHFHHDVRASLPGFTAQRPESVITYEEAFFLLSEYLYSFPYEERLFCIHESERGGTNPMSSRLSGCITVRCPRDLDNLTERISPETLLKMKKTLTKFMEKPSRDIMSCPHWSESPAIRLNFQDYNHCIRCQKYCMMFFHGDSPKVKDGARASFRREHAHQRNKVGHARHDMDSWDELGKPSTSNEPWNAAQNPERDNDSADYMAYVWAISRARHCARANRTKKRRFNFEDDEDECLAANIQENNELGEIHFGGVEDTRSMCMEVDDDKSHSDSESVSSTGYKSSGSQHSSDDYTTDDESDDENDCSARPERLKFLVKNLPARAHKAYDLAGCPVNFNKKNCGTNNYSLFKKMMNREIRGGHVEIFDHRSALPESDRFVVNPLKPDRMGKERFEKSFTFSCKRCREASGDSFYAINVLELGLHVTSKPHFKAKKKHHRKAGKDRMRTLRDHDGKLGIDEGDVDWLSADSD